jgi:hypothetical protein
VRWRREKNRERLNINGHLSLWTVDADGNVTDRREGDNIITVNGYTSMAAALVWSGVQDQALNLGITSPTFLTPLYGAVGNGTGTPTLTDTQLFSELSRTTVGAGASTPATSSVVALATWIFFFPNPATTWTVTEAGLFTDASSLVNSGSMLDHWAFSSSISVPTTEALVLQVSLQLGP